MFMADSFMFIDDVTACIHDTARMMRQFAISQDLPISA
jgi:hypothetical protein